MLGHVTILGCGNIGAYLCDLLARVPEVRCLTLVDFDSYTSENLKSQAISRTEVGKPKALALARRLKHIRPDLKISAHFNTLESMPLGSLDSDVICACLDSRVSRMSVNEAAWRLGRPWIDAGVLGSELLARVDVYLPAPERACMECAFTEQHYASLEIRYPCRSLAAPAGAPTNAPAYLGALAASLQAAECHKLLCSDLTNLQAGRQVLQGLRSHQHYVSVHRRNPRCRFDHRVFAPDKISGSRLLGSVLFRKSAPWEPERVFLSVPGQRLTLRAECPRCRNDWPVLQCVRDDTGPAGACPSCGEAPSPHPFMLHERLCAKEIPAALFSRPLRALGLRPGDLFTVTDGDGSRHFLVGRRSAEERGG